jgi:hypothetical protein
MREEEEETKYRVGSEEEDNEAFELPVRRQVRPPVQLQSEEDEVDNEASREEETDNPVTNAGITTPKEHRGSLKMSSTIS